MLHSYQYADRALCLFVLCSCLRSAKGANKMCSIQSVYALRAVAYVVGKTGALEGIRVGRFADGLAVELEGRFESFWRVERRWRQLLW